MATTTTTLPITHVGPQRPAKLSRPETTLQDKYVLDQGTVFLSGIQALVRVLLDQRRADVARGLDTGDVRLRLPGLAARRARQGARARCGDLARRARHPLHAGPERGARRDRRLRLAARANLPDARNDGVTGVWYGKNPGLDRAIDALRHANFAGTHPQRRRARARRRRPRAASPRRCRAPARRRSPRCTCRRSSPGTLQEVLDLGLHAVACSRASGLWSALKIVTNIADAAGTVAGVARARRAGRSRVVECEGRPYRHVPDGNLLAPMSLELERTLIGPRPELARQYARAEPAQPDRAAHARRVARHRRRRQGLLRPAAGAARPRPRAARRSSAPASA